MEHLFTIKVLLIDTILPLPFPNSSDANNFSSLVSVNIFLKIFIVCVLRYYIGGPTLGIEALLILGTPVFSTVPDTY